MRGDLVIVDDDSPPWPMETWSTLSEAKYMRGDAVVTLQEVHVGDRIVIHARKHDSKLQAAEVQLGKAKPAGAAK